MNRRTIVFERLTPAHLVAVGWYALRGYRITYLETAFDVPGPWWFRRLAASGAIRPIALQEPLYLRCNPAGDLACERTEPLYEQRYRRHPLIQRLVGLFEDERIHLAFQKYLHALLEQHYYYVLLGERLREALAVEGAFWFVPARGAGGALPAMTGANLPPMSLPFLRGRAIVGQVPPLPFQVPWWSQARGRFMEWWANGRVCAETALLAVGQYLFGRRPGPRRHDAFAVALIAPNREFANAIRGCDMLLDGERIRRDNTLFVPVARVSSAQRRMLHARGLRLAAHPCRPSGRILRKVLRHTGGVAAARRGTPWWIVRVAGYLVRDYGMWSSLLDAHGMDHFICYNDFSFRHIPRNILLSRRHVRTWYYADAVNTFSAFRVRAVQANDPDVNDADAINPFDGDFTFHQASWSYLLYDTYVSWNAVFARFVAAHPHAIGAFLTVGCLWSEHVRLLKADAIPSSLREELLRAGWSPTQQLVAVFDSTYLRDSLTDAADGLAFARDLLRLLDEQPELFVVWKEKKPRAPSAGRRRQERDLAGAYDALARHPRCYVTPHTTCPSEALALCDLAISFPFTSTAVEALGARVKSIYYDPHAKYRASYYAQIPGLVAHGYDALRQRVDELLAMRGATYDAYLDAVVKGAVDPYLDGRGLTRFRDALCAADRRGGAPRDAVEPHTTPLVSAATW